MQLLQSLSATLGEQAAAEQFDQLMSSIGTRFFSAHNMIMKRDSLLNLSVLSSPRTISLKAASAETTDLSQENVTVGDLSLWYVRLVLRVKYAS